MAEDTKRHERIAQAIDISATMDNCFFHAYALHLMANGLPFPDDLFTVHDTDGEEITNLKTIISNEKELSLFEDYERLTTGRTEEHLAEKVLVLGVLFRSWFIHLLKKNKETTTLLFNDRDNVGTPFYWVVESYKEGKEWLRESIRTTGNLYCANKAFFNSPDLQQVTCDSALKFWQKEGYDNYLRYLNQPKVKIFVHELAFILKFNRISYTIYNKLKACVSSENRLGSNHLELAIHDQHEHFYLVPNDVTADFLKRYAREYQQSLSERTAFLRIDSRDKLNLAKKSSFLLLVATLSEAELPVTNKSPLVHMVARLKELKSALAWGKQEQTGSQPHKPAPGALNLKNTNSAITLALTHPLSQSAESVSGRVIQEVVRTSKKSVPFKVHHRTVAPMPVKRPFRCWTEQEKNYAHALYELKLKALQFKDLSQDGKIKKYHDASVEIAALHRSLDEQFNTFLSASKSKASYERFARESIGLIDKKRKCIEQHRGMGKIIANVVLGIAGVLFVYLAVCSIKRCINQHFFFHPNTDTANKIKTLKKELGNLGKGLIDGPDEASDLIAEDIPSLKW